jgi:hypothetical protein
MLSVEREKTLCKKCNGKGHVGRLPFPMPYYEKPHKILCPKCCGLTELDWIRNIMGVDKSTAISIITHMINGTCKNLKEDNFVFLFGGTAYFIDKEFFIRQSTEKMFSHVRMNVPFVKENPGTLDMWRD